MDTSNRPESLGQDGGDPERSGEDVSESCVVRATGVGPSFTSCS
jgi:hypothetical protein